MKNFIVLICHIYFILNACSNQHNYSVIKVDNQLSNNKEDDSDIELRDSDIIYVLDFEKSLKSFNEDTFTINSIAKRISFIPLETSDTVLLYNDVFKTEKNNDGYMISSSSFFTHFHNIMFFDSTGHFKNYLLKRGQGPKELPYISEWSYNHNLRLLLASSCYQIILHSFDNNINNKYNLIKFLSDACLLNDGTIVVLPSIFGKGDTITPYLLFLNQEGKMVGSICYPQKRDIAFDFPEGSKLAYVEKYGLYPDYSGDALFKEMFNDTVYRISSIDNIKPFIVLHKGSLTPTLKDVTNPITAVQKVKLSQILNTKKYFIINYEYRNNIYTSIWNKKTKTLIANTIHPKRLSKVFFFNGYTNFRTDEGKIIKIRISSYSDKKLFCLLDADQAMDFLQEIKEDDNPILMIIEI